MNACQLKAKVVVFFAYLAAIYIMGSIIYLIVTRSYGTPFNDAVQKIPELVAIKEESVTERKKAFCLAVFISVVFISVVFLCLLKPFKLCECANAQTMGTVLLDSLK